MQPGDTIYLTIGRQTSAGAASSGKVLADFTIGTYLDGVSTSMSPAITEIGADGNWQEYKLALTLPSTAGRFMARIQPATTTDVIAPDMFSGEVENYDLDSVAALFLTSQGTPGVSSAADSSLGDVVDGDSFKSGTLTMPSGKLSPFGITDISAVGITVDAAVMATAGGTSYPIAATVVSGPGLTFTLSWPGGSSQPFPALTTENTKPQYIDVQVIKSGSPNIIVTTNRYTFNQVWQRDTRTS